MIREQSPPAPRGSFIVVQQPHRSGPTIVTYSTGVDFKLAQRLDRCLQGRCSAHPVRGASVDPLLDFRSRELNGARLQYATRSAWTQDYCGGSFSVEFDSPISLVVDVSVDFQFFK